MLRSLEQSGLLDLVADLREEAALSAARRLLEQGEDPLRVLEECQAGMIEVGERYRKKKYYLSGLIMAGEIMSQVGELLVPYIRAHHTGNEKGHIITGTVAGDIHYIGKNILKLLLQCYGFTVADLGEDVPASVFVDKALEVKPHTICLSCLLSSSIDSMRDIIAELQSNTAEMPKRPPIIIGGLVDQKVCEYVGADFWAKDAMEGVRYCQGLTPPI